jgi:hypothetical protein
MVEHMDNVVLDAIRQAMVEVKFLSISCDEITSIDNQTWASVHVYILKDWCMIPILHYLSREFLKE